MLESNCVGFFLFASHQRMETLKNNGSKLQMGEIANKSLPSADGKTVCEDFTELVRQATEGSRTCC